MNELEVVLSGLASIGDGADCGICNAIRNAFDFANGLGIGVVGAGAAVVGTTIGNALRDPIGTASDVVSDVARDAGTVAGTVVTAANTVAGAATDIANNAQDAFNQGYQDAGGGTGSPPPSTSGNPWTQAFPGNPWAQAFSGTPPNSPMAPGTLNYFNLGSPTGSQIGNEQ